MEHSQETVSLICVTTAPASEHRLCTELEATDRDLPVETIVRSLAELRSPDRSGASFAFKPDGIVIDVDRPASLQTAIGQIEDVRTEAQTRTRTQESNRDTAQDDDGERPIVVTPQNGSETLAAAALRADVSEYVPATDNAVTRVLNVVREETATTGSRGSDSEGEEGEERDGDGDEDEGETEEKQEREQERRQKQASANTDPTVGTSTDPDFGPNPDSEQHVERDAESTPAPNATHDDTYHRIIANELPDEAFVIGADGTYLESKIRPSSAELYTISAAELVGKRLTDAFPEETATQLQDCLDRALRTGEVQSVEYSVETTEGRRRYEARVVPIDERIDGQRAVIWLARDITERAQRERRLRARQANLETLNRINAVIRQVIETLVDAPTRDAIEREVCAELVDSDLYCGCWIAERTTNGEFTYRTGAGEATTYLEAVRNLDDARYEHSQERTQAGASGESEADTATTTVAGEEADDDTDGSADEHGDSGRESEHDGDGGTDADTDSDTDTENGATKPASPTDIQRPVERTGTTGEILTANHILEREPLPEPIQAAASEDTVRAAISVPIVHEQTIYGVLTVLASRADAFSDTEQEAFKLLGETMGFSIMAVKSRQLLFADTVTELEFRIDGGESFSFDLTTEYDCTCSLEWSGTTSDGRPIQYVTVDGLDGETVIEAASEHESIESCRLIHDGRDHCTIEMRLVESGVRTIANHGGTIRDVTVTDGVGTCIVEVPQHGDVREVAEALSAIYESTELMARREVDRPVHTAVERRNRIHEELTDRQLTTLRLAYFSGFFEWPRSSTGEEIAETMGVTPPTMHQHLRKGLKTVLSEFFEEGSSPTE
ncbi:bacterio-opsin activator domain-containing protein [Natrialba aegyptia]|uniref:PAS/PAC sensor protein n=1 Tax=Natrialba aegyptia DSM 13077 TaxID=1227491 RepID=M0BDT9_9EURY|nr:bacterio-opsin activator domain-containing protein [Natrialba aegyptia]ELZ07824.1 PAS/PAC sensor protein [Natrialba aegyptia DSM 13077]